MCTLSKQRQVAAAYAFEMAVDGRAISGAACPAPHPRCSPLQMRKFVSIPTAFTGFANSALFPPMAARNAASVAQVYRKAEILLARLGMVRDRMRPWVALGVIDIDAFVDAKCTAVGDFEANYAALRVRGTDTTTTAPTWRVSRAPCCVACPALPPPPSPRFPGAGGGAGAAS